VCCLLDGNLRVRSDIIRRENLDTRSNVLVGKSPLLLVCVCAASSVAKLGLFQFPSIAETTAKDFYTSSYRFMYTDS
jgi:hypothetical protein